MQNRESGVMADPPQPRIRAVMVENELFKSQIAVLDNAEQQRIWRSLRRARDGRATPGVERRWDGDWLLWPCGAYKVLLRPMSPEEVADTGATGEGIYLMGLEPSPF
jgi:hypothetical protein